jgi:hypothetical protein
MGWPQYVLAGMMIYGAGVSFARFGERKRDSYDLVDALIGPIIVAWILYMGGFWGG